MKDFPVRAGVCRTCLSKKRRARYAAGDPLVNKSKGIYIAQKKKKKPPTREDLQKLREDFSEVT